MKSQITLIREAVKILNKHPGLTKRWPFKINLRRLKMNDGCQCVLGQLFGNYDGGKRALGFPSPDKYKPLNYGFHPWMSDELWKTKIRQLRASYHKQVERKQRKR